MSGLQRRLERLEVALGHGQSAGELTPDEGRAAVERIKGLLASEEGREAIRRAVERSCSMPPDQRPPGPRFGGEAIKAFTTEELRTLLAIIRPFRG